MPAARAAIAYRIVTARLLLRCWDPADAAPLNEAIAVNLDHLRPWMPWAANAPVSLDEQIARLIQCRSVFPQEREYGIFDRGTGQLLGGIGFPNRIGAGAREIGYWIRADHARQGLMTEAAAAMTRIGFALDRLRRVEIHCDPRNVASAGIPRKLGFLLQCLIPMEVLSPASSPRDTMIWTLRRSEFPAAPASTASIEVFDVMGRALPLPSPIGAAEPALPR